MIDLTPSINQLVGIVGHVKDDQLEDPTPCADYTVGALLDHIAGFCLAFTGGALKEPPVGHGGPSGSAETLMAGWRTEIPSRLGTLAEAWRAPDAWEGMTVVAGVDLPGAQAGLFGLDEVVMHTWDLAKATGQSFDIDDEAAGALEQLLVPLPAPEMAQVRGGLFGPIVEASGDGSRAERVLGLTGRDPAWGR
jgi:uncharacterized protein (TIGR03086 family)